MVVMARIGTAGLALVILAGCGEHELSTPTPAVRNLNAAERATLVAGARAIATGHDPAMSGLDAHSTVAWRTLVSDVEAGRFEIEWPKFGAEVGGAASTIAADAALAAAQTNEHAAVDITFLRQRFSLLITALDSGNLAMAKSAADQLAKARDAFAKKYK